MSDSQPSNHVADQPAPVADQQAPIVEPPAPIAEPPVPVAEPEPETASIHDFAEARQLEPWQRHVLTIHTKAAGIVDAAPVAQLDKLLDRALRGRI